MNCSSRMLILLPACSSARQQQLDFHVSLPQVSLSEPVEEVGYVLWDMVHPRVLFSLIWPQGASLLQILILVVPTVCYRDRGLSRQGSQIPLSVKASDPKSSPVKEAALVVFHGVWIRLEGQGWWAVARMMGWAVTVSMENKRPSLELSSINMSTCITISQFKLYF